MTITLQPDAVHVYHARFSLLAPSLAAYTDLLTGDERARAARFIGDDVRDKFILARGFLRTVLATYVGIDPADLRFEYGPRGKPALANGPAFNMAHGGDALLLAVTGAESIGADVEPVRSMPEMRTVAHDTYAAAEFAAWDALPVAEQPRAFYVCWTRKEAYIKARGEGFHLPTSDFEVTLRPDEPPRLLRATDDDPARWSLYDCHPPLTGYVGALCVLGDAHTVTTHTFTS